MSIFTEQPTMELPRFGDSPTVQFDRLPESLEVRSILRPVANSQHVHQCPPWCAVHEEIDDGPGGRATWHRSVEWRMQAMANVHREVVLTIALDRFDSSEGVGDVVLFVDGAHQEPLTPADAARLAAALSRYAATAAGYGSLDDFDPVTDSEASTIYELGWHAGRNAAARRDGAR